jgi:hypothetical protein
MRIHKLQTTLLAALIMLMAGTAAAVDADFSIVSIETALPPGGGDELADLVINPDGTATTNMLAAGNLITVQVTIANPTNEFLKGIFTSLVFEGAQLEFLGSQNVPSEILVGGTTFGPTSLTRVAVPDIKINTPNLDDGSGGPVWLQATAFGSGAGTDGAGPDSYNIFFTVRSGVGSGDMIDMTHALTDGDASDAPTLNLGSTGINVPEPGTMALGLASLGTVGLAVRLRRRFAL